jgi:asparagine synthase (glutamine-hydrolysing)
VDVEVFNLAGRMPPEAKLNLRRGKQVLRDAFRDVLPPWINDDSSKKTFTLPLMKWMRLPKWQARIRDTLTAQRCRERGLVAAKEVDAICARFFDSRNDTKSAWHLSQPVWMLYVLEEWARRNLPVRA